MNKLNNTLNQKHVLIIDDDEHMCRSVRLLLEQEDIVVSALNTGSEVFTHLARFSYDLILLDLKLGDINGMDILQKIRADYEYIPVIIVSANHQLYHKITGFGLGANDYITKPFNDDEFIARVKAHLRAKDYYTDADQDHSNKNPTPETCDHILQYKNLKLDTNSLNLFIDNKEVQLQKKIFTLLKMFMEQPDRVFTKEQLYEHAWDDSFFDDNLVMVYIGKLRKLINKHQSQASIVTIKTVGYKLTEIKDD